MKQSNEDIGNIMDKVLEQHTPSIEFESVWKKVFKNERKIWEFKRVVAIPLIALISLLAVFSGGFASYSTFRNIDRTDYPFIDDSRVKGKWESVDFVAKIDDFNPEKKSWKGDLYLTALVFIKEGRMLTAVDNGNLANTSFSWTKGMVLSNQEKTASKYLIKDINGTTYMFFEWKSGDYVFRNETPKFYVLKQIDSEDYSNYQVKRVKEDKVDYPFIDDAKMKGKWESVDFVQKMDDFEPGEQSWLGDLFLTGLHFDENGKLITTTKSGSFSGPSITWTKGLIINKDGKTASKCEIKNISGATYMFYEWKSGDYVFRGMRPWYYVLKKVE